LDQINREFYIDAVSLALAKLINACRPSLVTRSSILLSCTCHVAQTFSLPYRRFVIGRASASSNIFNRRHIAATRQQRGCDGCQNIDGLKNLGYVRRDQDRARAQLTDPNHHTQNMKTLILRATYLSGILLGFSAHALLQAAEIHAQPLLRVLFLGDNGHHRPADRFKQMQPVLAPRGIELTYTDALDDLNPTKLAGYDCLLVYANHTQISPSQEKALVDFVAAGGGFVPLHCASYCFLNSTKYIELVGAQFKSPGTGVFKETIVHSDHPVLKDIQPIESWDETYVHTKHGTNRLVLAERRDDKGAEPWTWVREHGKGRVFYTAWGHDQRTWSNVGFQKLAENGIRWTSANSPQSADRLEAI